MVPLLDVRVDGVIVPATARGAILHSGSALSLLTAKDYLYLGAVSFPLLYFNFPLTPFRSDISFNSPIPLLAQIATIWLMVWVLDCFDHLALH